MIVEGDADLWESGSEFTENSFAVIVRRGASASLSGSQMNGNGNGLVVNDHATATLLQATIANSEFMDVFAGDSEMRGGYVQFKSSDIESLRLENGGRFRGNGTIRGDVSAVLGSDLDLLSATVLGDVLVFGGSQATLLNAEVEGKLTCEVGGDAACGAGAVAAAEGCPGASECIAPSKASNVQPHKNPWTYPSHRKAPEIPKELLRRRR